MLRAECEAKTPLGLAAASVLASGALVGDEIVNQMLVSRLHHPDCRDGFLLDGYPRTVPQAVFLDNFLESNGFPTPTVIHLDVPSEVLVARISSRRQCPACGRIYNTTHQRLKAEGRCDDDGAELVRRKDDKEEIVRERLRAYEDMTRLVIPHYAGGDYHRIDGTRPPPEVFTEVQSILEPALVRVKKTQK